MNKAWWLPLLLVGCGGRPEALNHGFVSKQTVGLDDSVAVLDPSLDRVLMLSSPGPLELTATPLPVGLNVATTKASPDGKQLFVLSKGIQPRRQTSDQLPRLTVIETGESPRIVRTYEFNDPLSGLVLDERDGDMEWAIAYVTPEDSRAVRNPNEIILIDLKNPEAAPIPLTVQSGGSSPKSFLFTDPLLLPGGDEHRFLVVQTEHDVVLIDLADAANAENGQIRVEMPRTAQDAEGSPAQVVFHSAAQNADPNDDQESKIAVRMGNDSNVYLLAFSNAADPFSLRPNLVDVGGLPSTIEFVQTNAGVRLLALVGGKGALVDPRTSNSVQVDLKTAYKRITRVTEEVAGEGGDVALLWSDQAPEVGLWNLGRSTTTSHGLETVDVGTTVSQVIDVPGESFPTYKILESRQGDFYVLDLQTQETSPMDTNGRDFTVAAAPDGERLWAFLPGGSDFASIDLQNLHAISLSAERPITGLFDVSQTRGGGGRTAIVLHEGNGDLAATVLNALDPDSAVTRFYSGLVFEGITP